MKIVPVEQGVGLILCQDITKIVPGEFKGRAFKRGHVIRKEDVGELLKMGKAHVYVWESKPGEIHEEEAALRLAQALTANESGTAPGHISISQPYEGKCTLNAEIRGLFRVQKNVVDAINSIESLTVATLPDHLPVESGQGLAGTRIIPLLIEEKKLLRAEQLCKGQISVLRIIPYRRLKASLIITGFEIFHGLTEDKFGPVILDKLKFFGAEYLGQTLCQDNLGDIRDAIMAQVNQGSELVILTGGMSVDPDDLTPGAIKATGAEIVTYGVPVQPGNMFMLSYLGNTAIIGVPGCAMYHRTTILDVVLPRLFAGEKIVKSDMTGMGVGGFCSSCQECHYPTCYFGTK